VSDAAPAPAPTPAAPELVAVERLRVEFGPVAAVDDVTFSLRGGHLLGLIGPNGAGKTTLLRAVAGVHPPTRGRVRILGEPLSPGGGEDLLRHVGFTPDTPAVYEELSVRQFLRFIAKGYALAGREVDERIDFWLERVWLTEKADQRIKELSRGMRQRVGLARTLLPNPSVILLDEPAAGLDPAGRVQFRQLLSSLRDQGKALVVSSHILADMSEYCTHIGIMARGRLLRFGTVAEVAGDAAHADGARCRYTAVLARAVPRLAEVLRGLPGATAIDADGDRVTLDYAVGRDAAAELLAALMARGLPVASFAAHAPGLEEAYLRAGIGQVD
jgi:ABC-2 type transport system ATP-binding protein